MLKHCTILGLLLSLFATVQADERSEPERIVISTTNNVLQILRQEKDTFSERPGRLFDIVEKYVLPNIDFSQMSRLVLGKYWRIANAEQKTRFIKEFQILLVRTYANALLRYIDADVVVLPSRPSARPGRAVVRSEVRVKDGKPLPISYLLYRKGGVWKIYDVNIDSVSLVVNYRASFKSEISRDRDIDKLIEKIRDKNLGAAG